MFLAIFMFSCKSTFGRADLFGPVELSSPKWTVRFDPATLGVTAETVGGVPIVLSAAQPGTDGAVLVKGDQARLECLLRERGLHITVELNSGRLTMRFVSDRPGEITGPVIPAQKQLKAYILPMFEGVYAPTGDDQWMDHLIERGPMDTTADLSMPFVGLDYGDKTVTYIFDNIFDNRVEFQKGEQGVGVGVTHRFRPNWDKWEYTVVVELGDGSPIEPARKYRAYLAERGEHVSMREKIDTTPSVERLLGAAHAYLWDAGIFSHLDATDWKGFCAKLIEEGQGEANTLGKRLWDSFVREARDAAVQITREQWPSKYLKSMVAAQVSAHLELHMRLLGSSNPREPVLGGFCEHFVGLVRPYDEWGGGISVGMLDELRGAGLDRMVLCLGDLSSADRKPQVARRAEELGYLFGPYDSYHSIHPPASHPDYDAQNTWDTAQFGQLLYETGAIVKEDGTKSAGFKKVGYHLSPLAARPYVEDRVNAYMHRLRFSAVFVDADAFGQFFDDYHPDHTATKRDDMLERLDRLRWLSEAHSLVVGSEGGSAYATPAIHFAHGMLTPVIGWGDADLKDKASPYYLGAYYPPDGPAVFTKQVPLKPAYKKFHYDPRYRLPLYQAVFHDSVVTTHHWHNASLKFADQVKTVALLEQLYNVPPLYHLNPDEFQKHKAHILAHHAFFSPLHRDLALEPITGFRWLTDDRRVQQTTFGDGTTITANFGDHATEVDGHALPAGSVMAVRPRGDTSLYTPVTRVE